MISHALMYLLGAGTGVLYTICWQQAAKSDEQLKRLDALRGKRPVRGRR